MWFLKSHSSVIYCSTGGPSFSVSVVSVGLLEGRLELACCHPCGHCFEGTALVPVNHLMLTLSPDAHARPDVPGIGTTACRTLHCFQVYKPTVPPDLQSHYLHRFLQPDIVFCIQL